MTSASLERATYRVSEYDLEYMVLDKGSLPEEFRGYQQVRVGVLDNENMAAHGVLRQHRGPLPGGRSGNRLHAGVRPHLGHEHF